MQAPRTPSSKAIAAKVPTKGRGKKGTRNIKTKTLPKKPSGEWALKALLDASLEFRPPLRSLNMGERSLDFSVQAQSATLPQGDSTQVTLRMRAEISLPEGPMVLSELLYVGVAEIPETPANVLVLHEALYPSARHSLLELLKMVGQVPPIPETLAEVKRQ